MIQRIQTLFLFLAALLTGVLCFRYFTTFLHEAEVFRQTVLGIYSTQTPDAGLIVKTTPMGILAVLATLLPVVMIFLYKKRELQARLCMVEIILQLGLLVYMGMYLLHNHRKIAEWIAFSVVDLFPLLAGVLTFLAMKRILQDIALVRSLDRIR
jgi:hypothetical protein